MYQEKKQVRETLSYIDNIYDERENVTHKWE